MKSILDFADQNYLEAWFPRGLIGNGTDILSVSTSAEGLCPLRVIWEKGKIIRIKPIDNTNNLPTKLVLPRLVEPHSHIDKAFTWSAFPNLKGTYAESLESNLAEHKTRTPQVVRCRAEKALFLALKNGLRAIRSHVDAFGPSGEKSLQTLFELRSEWKTLIDLQCIALVPLEYWDTTEGRLLAGRVAAEGGLLGTDKFPAAGLKQLIRALDHLQIKIPITCSHLSSMSLLPQSELARLADAISSYEINVIALPLTNSWLLGRQLNETSIIRPLAPIKQLQKAGVTVAIGGDNIQDPWFPLGGLDPISLMAFSMPLTQLAPWHRLGLSPFTTSAANVLKLDWDGTIQVGSPADFIALDASNWVEALSIIPSREVLIEGNLLDETMLPNRTTLKDIY